MKANERKLQIEFIRTVNRSAARTPDLFNPHFEHMNDKRFVKQLKKVINEDLMLHQRYLFVERIGNKVYTFCSHCGHKGTMDKVGRNLREYECENCKSIVYLKNVKYNSYKGSTFKSFLYFANSSLTKDIIIAYEFEVKRYVNRDNELGASIYGIKIEDSITLNKRYYFDRHSPCRLMSYSPWQKEWTENRTIFNPSSNYYSGWHEESLIKAVKKSEDHKYLIDSILNKCNPVKLLELYCKYPDIEKLEKIGLGRLLQEKTSGDQTLHTINWKAKTVYGMLKLNRPELKFFKESTRTGFLDLFFIQNLKKAGHNIESEFKAYEKLYQVNSGKNIEELLKADKPSRILSYLEKQTKDKGSSYNYLRSALIDFWDVVKDMKELGMDINKRTIYPKNLKKTHQDIAEMFEIVRDEIRDAKISERAQKLNDYALETHGYVIKPFESTDEILEESKQLKHCVRNYVDSYADGKTNLFSLRSKKEPEKPLYTIEVSKSLKIVQCQGRGHYSINRDEKNAMKAYKAFEETLTKPKRSANHERIAN